MNRLATYLNTRVHIAPLVTLRIVFGLIMCISMIRFWWLGRIESLYIKPKFFFTYYGFEWVKPFEGIGMYILFFIVGFSAFCMALGFLYRINSILFFLSFTYTELLDKSNYLNHYYFVSIAGFLMIFLPAHKYFSMDVWLKIVKPVTHIPIWMRDTFKLQLGMVYFFAGLAKLNPDWLFEALPLKVWLDAKADMPLIGWMFKYSWIPYFFSWFGAVYDLCIPFLLTNKRFRVIGYFFVIVFHILTWVLFEIGMFPFIMIGATLIFFSEAWHIRLINFLKKFSLGGNKLRETYSYFAGFRLGFIKYLFIAHFVIQLVLPFRYLLYPGELFWTEEGFRFSWRVMLVEKAGTCFFTVGDKNFEGTVEISNSDYLLPYQEKFMSYQPDMILQFAHHLRDEFKDSTIIIHGKNFTFTNPVVKVHCEVDLNRRGSRLFVDPTVDLAREQPGWSHKTWILPYTQ